MRVFFFDFELFNCVKIWLICFFLKKLMKISNFLLKKRKIWIFENQIWIWINNLNFKIRYKINFHGFLYLNGWRKQFTRLWELFKLKLFRRLSEEKKEKKRFTDK